MKLTAGAAKLVAGAVVSMALVVVPAPVFASTSAKAHHPGKTTVITQSAVGVWTPVKVSGGRISLASFGMGESIELAYQGSAGLVTYRSVVKSSAKQAVKVPSSLRKMAWQAKSAGSGAAAVAAPGFALPGTPATAATPTADPAPVAAPVVDPAPATVTPPAPAEPAAPAAPPAPAAPAAPAGPTSSVLSGVSGNGAADGTFAAWRGTPVAIAGTWNDSLDAQTNQWSIQPGAEFGSWNSDLDVAVGAIYSNNGETWAKAATGTYDARWRTALQAIKNAWGARAGTLHIRFAHEFNGSWVPWAVTGATANDFVTSWKRFRALQKEILPTSKLVFCPNDGSSSSAQLDWRTAFPGAAFVDEMAVDTYNQYPFVNTAADFAVKANSVDGYGAPTGIEKHRQFAASVGLPFAIAEWSSNSSMGDSSVYIQQMREWINSHAGTGAGQVVYEIFFNVASFSNGVFQVFPATKMPAASAAYIAAF